MGAQGTGAWGDWSKQWGGKGGYMGGQHPYWSGQGVTPQYEKSALPELTRELLDSKQIDETIVYATRGIFPPNLTFRHQTKSRQRSIRPRG